MSRSSTDAKDIALEEVLWRSERLAPGVWLRPALDADSAGIIAVIEHAFQDYPGCLLDVDLEEPELRAPASSFEAFWVLVENGAVVGTSAAKIARAGAEPHVEIKKVYLAHHLRGRGLGQALVARVEELARAAGLARVELWSDSRFALGHRVYERLGYARTGRERRLHDISDTLEYHFARRL